VVQLLRESWTIARARWAQVLAVGSRVNCAAHLIKVLAPSFDQMPGFGQSVEEFAIEQLIPKFGVERFIVAIFPRAAGLDIQGFDLRRSGHIGQFWQKNMYARFQVIEC
jgi:hypothetical protein